MTAPGRNNGARMFARLADIPALVWVFVAVVVSAGGRYVQLLLQRRRHRGLARSSTRGLRLLYDGLATFAKFNDARLPASLEGDDWAFARPYVYRPTPRWGYDERLVIAYDREPHHRLIEFPTLRAGRAVLLGTGRVVVVSQTQFERLMDADNRLRESLGLEPPGRQVAEHGMA